MSLHISKSDVEVLIILNLNTAESNDLAADVIQRSFMIFETPTLNTGLAVPFRKIN